MLLESCAASACTPLRGAFWGVKPKVGGHTGFKLLAHQASNLLQSTGLSCVRNTLTDNREMQGHIHEHGPTGTSGTGACDGCS